MGKQRKKIQPVTQKQAIQKKQTLVLWFKDISKNDISLVGGKNASLGEMYQHLNGKGVTVPNGFAITAKAYRDFMKSTGLRAQIKVLLKDLDVGDVAELKKRGKQIRKLVLATPLPESLQREVAKNYHQLSSTKKEKHLPVAVRSSATAEDLPEASFAGQQESYLNVRGDAAVIEAVHKCIASLFTDRAISYREKQGFDHLSIALSVSVQVMVHAGGGASGVMFTLDTESGFRDVVLINASYGLGEYVVKGRINPDQYYVFKPTFEKGKPAIISRSLGTKEVQLDYGKNGGTRQKKVSVTDRNKYAISDADVLDLTKAALIIEKHYGCPQDIEWAKEKTSGRLYIVQARPETVKARSAHAVIERYQLNKEGDVLLTGVAVGQKIGAGTVRIIENPKDAGVFKKGDVLVTRITDPDWEPIMQKAAAIVTEQGGKTSHAAIVSRELGVPCVVGAEGARKVLKNNQKVTVSCAKGDEATIYKGILPFEVKRTEIKNIAQTKTKVMMNVGDPDNAFSLSFLPHDGIGLARLEFIFSNFIRIHPLALLHYKTLKDKVVKKKIALMTRGYKDKAQFCIDKLAEGIARIAASSYKRPVVVRLSDFKTNEYATLTGGKDFEPKEENPMIGWRGASRYYSEAYKAGFQLECEAIKKVRDEWGLDNVIVMIPFCRTPEEGEKVLATMKEFGLERGKNGLKVYVMCEIPSNVILAKEFAELFDGFSIGTNDLTQLTLGLDRDTTALAHIGNENNEAVKRLIAQVITVAHAAGKPVGICGQAPSDYPDFTKFLIQHGIDSISLNPDTVVDARRVIAAAEQRSKSGNKQTNKKYLSYVIGMAGIAIGLMGLGAGCATGSATFSAPSTEVRDVSAADIREAAMQQVAIAVAQTQEEYSKETRVLRERDFLSFDVTYPAAWEVEHWNGGLTLHNSAAGPEEYISLYKELIVPPIDKAQKKKVLVGGIVALRYDYDGESFVEIPVNDVVLVVQGNAAAFDTVLESVQVVDDGAITDRELTHWDIREKRTCVPVLTYARESQTGTCQAFPTPCDIPESWSVCDEGDM
ncbi:MAG: phosphoenolpyruvate synthase [Candidatus Magasanikbacteria bacterium CG10_big_fil_rev_8_21_14_0_10_47_10]|uniref:Phosphoenolpyruvate synthase n=1 Tax=Candidatus Magasanikbacteria bacterium CG10_big_fil_rev_8_21_14_0_10_47_10 TaxID=1974652 RepID=A0A2H0TQY3_9BACT|nr:MAG: phosphoenolpyruvate synthase [Candidatus Magasanikbacteria bacterium CG10_big_fil_rev_8_21_14_0_10_47_10]